MMSSRPTMRVSLGGSLGSRSETVAPLGDEGCSVERCGMERVTGATKQYPRPGTVTM